MSHYLIMKGGFVRFKSQLPLIQLRQLSVTVEVCIHPVLACTGMCMHAVKMTCCAPYDLNTIDTIIKL